MHSQFRFTYSPVRVTVSLSLLLANLCFNTRRLHAGAPTNFLAYNQNSCLRCHRTTAEPPNIQSKQFEQLIIIIVTTVASALVSTGLISSSSPLGNRLLLHQLSLLIDNHLLCMQFWLLHSAFSILWLWFARLPVVYIARFAIVVIELPTYKMESVCADIIISIGQYTYNSVTF